MSESHTMARAEKSCHASAIENGIGLLRRDHFHGTAGELRPHQSGEPTRHVGLWLGRGDFRLRRHHRELAEIVHVHDADMAQMLELQRQFLIELPEPPLRGQIFQSRGDEALRHFDKRLTRPLEGQCKR